MQPAAPNNSTTTSALEAIAQQLQALHFPGNTTEKYQLVVLHQLQEIQERLQQLEEKLNTPLIH